MSKMLNQNQKMILNRYQRDFPLVPKPFTAIGAIVGLTEKEVMSELSDLNDKNIISRVGATVRPNRAGASTLAALSVPVNRLDEVAEIVNAQPEVNHNYERDHSYNLWFVMTTSDENALTGALGRIETLTGLQVLNLPLEKPYHIDLGFNV